MSYNCDINNITIKDLKSHLMEAGVYEADMQEQEMRDLFQILKHSEQSANEEKEYRETLSNANKHHEEVIQLISESTTKKENNYNLRSREKDTLDITTIDDNSNDTNFSPPSKSSEDTEMKEIPKVEEPPKSPKKTINIDVFCPCDTRREPLKIINNNTIVLQPFYCQPEIRKLPPELAVKAIKTYHDIIANHYRIVQNNSINLVPWGKAINLPKINLNKDDDDKEKEETAPNSTEQNDVYKCVRSRRQIKRKHYTELDSDEEDKRLISTKKSKENSVKSNEFDEMDKIFDDLKNSEDFNTSKIDNHCSSDEEPSMIMKVSVDIHNDGSNNKHKVFTSTPTRNKSKRITNKNTNNNTDMIECIEEKTATNKRKIIDHLDLVDENTDQVMLNEETTVVRRRIVPPNPFREKMSQRSEQKIKSLNARTKKRPNSVSKPESQKKSSNKENEELEEIKEISTKRFYGNNSNKLKSNTECTEEETYECPMCYKSFPVSIIQNHAAGCTKSSSTEKTEDPEKPYLCTKCDVYVIRDFEKHLEECQEVVK